MARNRSHLVHASRTRRMEGDVPDAASLLTCEGFPLRRAQTVPAGWDARVIVSINAFESASYIRNLVENTLNHTESSTAIVLHLNRLTTYANDDADFNWLWQQPRVLVNCLRVSVRRASGSILHAMGMNVRWAHGRGLSPSSFIVFQASNMWWVRPGMEKYVRMMQQSLPRISTSTQCRQFHQDKTRHALQDCSIIDASSEIESCTTLYASLDRTARPCLMPSLDGVRFLIMGKHEGSFYRLEDALRAFQLIANLSTAARRVLPSEQPLALWKQKCCNPSATWEKIPSGGYHAPNFCAEEMVLQTIVANGLVSHDEWQRGSNAGSLVTDSRSGPPRGDVLCRSLTEQPKLNLELPAASVADEATEDADVRFHIQWPISAIDAHAGLWREERITANCSWLRRQAAGVFALKAAAFRQSEEHRTLRFALRRCKFPQLDL